MKFKKVDRFTKLESLEGRIVETESFLYQRMFSLKFPENNSQQKKGT